MTEGLVDSQKAEFFLREAAIVASSITEVHVDVQNSEDRGETLRGSKSASVAGMVKGGVFLVLVADEEAGGG